MSKLLPEKISIVGHSYGAYLSLGLLYKYNLKIDQVFLTCPVVIGDMCNRKIETTNYIYSERFEVEENKDYYNDYLNMNVVINSSTWLDYQRSIIPGLTLFNHSLWNSIQTNDDYSFSFEKSMLADLPSCEGYVLLSESDNVVGYKDQRSALKHKIKHLKIVIDSGHNLLIDQKKIVLDCFEKFLSNI